MFICERCGKSGKRCAGPWCRKCYNELRKGDRKLAIPLPPLSNCRECGTGFQPSRWGERFSQFCSATCNNRFKLKTDGRREYMRNYYRENPEQCEKRAERARNWWTPERRYKYHPSKTTPRPAAWNKGLTRSDPRVDANIRAASDTRRRRVFLTNAESLHLKELVRYGSDNNLWKGGVTPAEHKLLTSRKGREWSRYIIARFGFQCFCCNATVKLLAHHIFSRKHYPELAFHPDNGVSLCISCHRKLHGMAPKDKERLDAWRKRTLAPVGYAIPESLTTYLVT